jgi:hypothetical protein
LKKLVITRSDRLPDKLTDKESDIVSDKLPSISIELHPKDNADLAKSLVSIGFQKTDGTPLDSASMSRIKKVASQLKTPEPL